MGAAEAQQKEPRQVQHLSRARAASLKDSLGRSGERWASESTKCEKGARAILARFLDRGTGFPPGSTGGSCLQGSDACLSLL